jgi:citrate lyase subunit beta/citryl-CoA lyase
LTSPVRPRRSALYVPGSNPRALEKAPGLPVDVVIMDLEDAVAPSAKEEARGAACAAARDRPFGFRERVIRVNGLGTPWGRGDLAAVARAGVEAVLLPKVQSGEEVREALGVLDGAGAPGSLAVWCMVETPAGVLRCQEVATASPRVSVLVMGTSDLTKDLRALHTPDRLPLLPSLGHALLVARACGLAILDGVHLDLDDEEGFTRACRQGRALGFDGKTLIHPKTVEVANRVFSPHEEEVAWSRRVVEAHGAAQSRGEGVVVVDGRLVEGLHVEEARRVLDLHGAIGARG